MSKNIIKQGQYMRLPHSIRFFAILAIVGLFAPVVAAAKAGDTTTWMSKVYDGDGGDGLSAYLDTPQAFAADAQCNLYIADTNNFSVRRLDHATNIMTTVLGNGQYGSKVVNANPLTSQMKAPAGIVQAPNGDWYVSDRDEGTVRMVNAAGTFNRTVAKGMKQPNGLASDGTYLYIAETGRNRILRMLWSTAQVDAGAIPITTSSVYAFSLIASPWHLAVDGDELYVTSFTRNAFEHYKMSSMSMQYGATYTGPEGITVYNHDVYFTTNFNGVTNQIRKYVPNSGEVLLLQDVAEIGAYNHPGDLTFCGGKMYLLMTGGTAIYQADLDGANPVKIAGAARWNTRFGARSQALVGRPKAFARFGSKLYILQNHQFAKLELTTMQLTFMAGRDGDAYTDGVGDTAHISGPTQMVISPDGKKIFFADRNNNRIRVLNTSTNEITTLTGAGKANLFNGQTNGYKEGIACPSQMSTGVAGCAYFTRPTGIAISPNGKTLYVTDSVNNRIRSVDVATGKTAFIAGSSQGYKNGVGSAARFNLPNNIVVSADGKTLYVADLQNHVIRMIDIRTKRVSTLAGVGKGGHLDGSFSKAYISFPDSLAWGPNSWTLYLSEVGSQQIRVLNLKTKIMTTLAGSGARGTQNGTPAKSAFNNPRGMIMIAANTLLVADSNNDLIRAIKTK